LNLWPIENRKVARASQRSFNWVNVLAATLISRMAKSNVASCTRCTAALIMGALRRHAVINVFDHIDDHFRIIASSATTSTSIATEPPLVHCLRGQGGG